MPPKRDVVFKIELQPGTAPVAKSPNKNDMRRVGRIEDPVERFA
jgi:hypothetical protein